MWYAIKENVVFTLFGFLAMRLYRFTDFGDLVR